MDLQASIDASRNLIANVERVLSGKRQAVTLAVAALLADVHLLVEDVPGVGKTVLARALARSIDADYRRIQGTPDLMPTDVTGAAVWNPARGEFAFVAGPVFTNVLLFDEINRATPRTQSALMEVMDERRVSIDGEVRDLPQPFFVVATANPVEHHGTYPLPEGELDRFGMSIAVGYPDQATERHVVRAQMDHHPLDDLDPVMQAGEVTRIRETVRRGVHIGDDVLDYVLAIVRATRGHNDLRLGASPRASLAMTHVAQALAIVRGRDYVTPDDVQAIAVPSLAHRIVLGADRRSAPGAARALVESVVRAVPVPVTT